MLREAIGVEADDKVQIGKLDGSGFVRLFDKVVCTAQGDTIVPLGITLNLEDGSRGEFVPWHAISDIRRLT